MSEKYIRENKHSYVINKSGKNYGKFKTLDDAIFAREILTENNWDLTQVKEVYEKDGNYIITSTLDDKLHFIAKYKHKPSKTQIQKLMKKHMRNPNNSKYGLNITKIFETFIIKKQIAGEEYIFGYYDNLEDAEFVRNHLMDHMWNVGSFSKISYDEEYENYKITEIIDDKVYVIDKYANEDEINLEKSYEKFLAKISKHKYGLASHPYLDELKEQIPELEEKFNVRSCDEVWNFDNVTDPLNDIIFNLTPFQKLVYDSIDNSTVEDVEKSLQRFHSRNFTAKIQKNLDELMDLKLISKNNDRYTKNN